MLNGSPRRPSQGIRRANSGFVMMDVLSAILLFSIGVLALVGLQSAMNRAQTEARIRADASYLANDLIGRIWSDINQLPKYTSSGCSEIDACEEWQSLVESTIPKGSGTVEANKDTGDVVITITWTMPSGDKHQYITQTSINKAGG